MWKIVVYAPGDTLTPVYTSGDAFGKCGTVAAPWLELWISSFMAKTECILD